MARCNSCSAPLPANNNRCIYCGIRNDVDLHAWNKRKVQYGESQRICPECSKLMQSIDLKIDGEFVIEHCSSCFGLFFDPGEIEKLLNHSVSNVFDVNYKHILNINRDRYQQRKIKYVPCPDCQVLMNRVNFGRRSGVVIDHCKSHGVWLNSGELTHLMEWKKAGGQMLDEQSQRKVGNQSRHSAKLTNTSHTSTSIFSSYERKDTSQELIENVASFIFKLFD